MGQELTVGRAYSNLLRLEGEEISRVHAIIYRRGEDFVLRDLDSKNGVLLNGQKVMNAILGAGDQVQVGNHLLLFDPPMDYDMDGFLKSHDASLEAEIHTTQSTDLEASYVFNRGAQNLGNGSEPRKAAPPAQEPEVFFNLAELEAEMEQLSAAPNAPVASVLLRLQKTITQEAAAEGLDGETRGLAQRLLSALIRAMDADRGVVVYKDDSEGGLTLAAIVPGDRDVAVNRVVLRSTLREGKAILCNDAQRDSRFSSTETVKKDRISSLMAYPISRQNQVQGLVYIDTVDNPGAFRREQLHVLAFVASLLSLTTSLASCPVRA